MQSKNIYMEKLNSDLQGRILTAKVFKEQEAFYITNIYAPAGAQKRKHNYIFFESLFISIHPDKWTNYISRRF